MEYLFVGIGGAVGAVARYAAGKFIGNRWKSSFPAATFFVNLTGSLILGFLAGYYNQAGSKLTYLQLMITMGFLGAYTTYSTFAFEIINLIHNRKAGIAAGYLLGSLFFGVLMALAGFWMAGIYLK